jgi:hypothetical protein
VAICSALVLSVAVPSALGQDTIPLPTPRPEIRESGPPRTKLPDDPKRFYQAACPALLSGKVTGRAIPPILLDGCGTKSPLAITALGEKGEVDLNGEVMVNCPMADTLANFALAASGLARQMLGAPIASLVTGPGFECRRRNRASEGKMSEHAFANAIDISAFKLEDGRTITVEEFWPHLSGNSRLPDSSSETEQQDSGPPVAAPAERAQSPEAKFLVSSHTLACTMFSTVLGPDANAAHRSHFHLDLGCHGRSCTYLLCE